MSPASESTEFESCASCASVAETMAETVAETVETADTITAITPQESFDEAYEELEQLGRGEFGIVRRAFHRKTGRQVAVKHMPKTTKSREELANLSQLTGHENVAKLLNHYETEKELLLVLELCDEGSLSDFLVKHLKGRRLGDEECALLMKQLLSAVKHCHDSGLVHNDLKFDNIMLASSAALPKLKLIEFGNAQSSTKKAPVDDMWFVGIIFYQLTTGQPFFQMDSDELESMDEQGCDAFYVQLRLSIAKRFGNSITFCPRCCRPTETFVLRQLMPWTTHSFCAFRSASRKATSAKEVWKVSETCPPHQLWPTEPRCDMLCSESFDLAGLPSARNPWTVERCGKHSSDQL